MINAQLGGVTSGGYILRGAMCLRVIVCS